MFGGDDDGGPEPPGPIEMAIIWTLFAVFLFGVIMAVVQRF